MSKALMKSLKADLPALAEMIRSKGRGRDTMLAHITPREAALLKRRGGSGSVNPDTGLPEFEDSGFYDYSAPADVSPVYDVIQPGGEFQPYTDVGGQQQVVAPAYTPGDVSQYAPAQVSYGDPYANVGGGVAAAPAAAPAAASPSPSASSAPASPAPAAIVAPHFALTVPNKVITIGSSVTNGYLINTSGGPVDTYLIFPAAPTGTSFDAATGLLSGTPTNQQAATQYQITGVNTSGIFQVIYTLTVNARPSASSGTAANIIRLGSLKAMRVGAADQVIPGLASSNLPIVYTTSNSAVCEIVTGTSLVHAKAAGDCQIIANQEGNGTYGQANSVTSAVFTVIAANDTRWIVVLDPNGGLNNGSSAITWQLVASGSSITLPAGLTNLPGYITYLWQYDSVANVNTAAHTFIPTADTTLVAKWS